MGKSETARMFKEKGVPVFDADATVHQLQAKGGLAIPAIEAAFPDVVQNGRLDRQKLGTLVFANEAAKKQLEDIIHPMVGQARKHFFEKAEAAKEPFVVLDVPLLFETGGHKKCDKVVVVSAPAGVQRERVLMRPGMTAEKFEHILSQQTPDTEKRADADYIIETDKGLAHAEEAVSTIITDLKGA